MNDGAMSSEGARWRVVPVTTFDYEKFAILFEESFGHRMSEAEWRWKYAAGRGQALFALEQDRPVAHYGGLTRAVLHFGLPVLACQPVDVLVSPRERGVLTRRGPMFLTATALFEAEMGIGRRHLLGFGFPTSRHLVLAERLGLFVPGGRLLELRWGVRSDRPDWSVGARDMNGWDTARFNRFADAVWREMAADLTAAIVGIRDSAWLRYRYLDHPTRRYRIVAVRSRLSGRALGVIVLRIEEARCELLDLIGPIVRLPMLVEVARWLAGQSGAQSLFCWVAESFAHGLDATRPERGALDVSNVVFTWTRVPPVAQTRDRWWLSAGDTDFR